MSDRGTSVTMPMNPVITAAFENPYRPRYQATAGTMRPPSAKPACDSDSAVARLARNQWTSTVVSVRKPQRLAPIEMRM